MATATSETTRVQETVQESARAGFKALDALTDYYLASLDAGLKFQSRYIETAKMLLDETAAFQRSNRKLAEELIGDLRKAEKAVTESYDVTLKGFQSPLVPGAKR